MIVRGIAGSGCPDDLLDELDKPNPGRFFYSALGGV
jgi:hypothetical protein